MENLFYIKITKNYIPSLTFLVKPNKAGMMTRHDINHARPIKNTINLPVRCFGYVIGFVIIKYLSKIYYLLQKYFINIKLTCRKID